MKYKTLFISAILGLSPMTVSAHGGHDHDADTAVARETISLSSGLNRAQDLVAAMEESLSDAKRAELLADGPIMQTLHDKAVAVQEVLAAFEKSPSLSPDQAKRLLPAYKQLLARFDAFHAATHEQNEADAVAELKKAQSALRLIETYSK